MNRASRPCPVPGCPNLTTMPKGCSRHRHESEHRALYDPAWDTLAALWLTQHRTCQMCRQRPSREVHHKQSPRIAPHLRLDPANVIALCHPCHRVVTPTTRADAGSTKRRR